MKLRELEVVYKATDIEMSDKKINCSKEVYQIFKFLANCDRERLCALHLNARNQLLGFEFISIGTVTESMISPREVFKAAVLRNTVSLILVHNHPSGHPEPSKEDKTATSKIKQVGELFQITLIDHIIIGHDRYFSFKESGLL